MDKWTPAATGTRFELSEILAPLEPFKNQLCVVSGLAHAAVAPWTGEDTGGAENHVRAAAVFLSGAHPVKGDQAHRRPDRRPGRRRSTSARTRRCRRSSCRSRRSGSTATRDFTCAYRNTLAWKSATLPLPMENNPQVVFERLFGDGSTDAERAARRAEARSLLDSVIGQVGVAARRSCPPRDRRGSPTIWTRCARSSGACRRSTRGSRPASSCPTRPSACPTRSRST